MLAYGGTYKFDGKKIEHHVDISWNGSWTGMTTVPECPKGRRQTNLFDRPGPNLGRRQEDRRDAHLGKDAVRKQQAADRDSAWYRTSMRTD